MLKLLTNQVVVGPMAGITDDVFRKLIWEQGPALVWTEMISAQALLYNNPRTWQMAVSADEKGPVVVQLFGKEPDLMARAAQKLRELKPAALDINMGCPAPKIVNNGEGAALLKNPSLAAAIVQAMVEAVELPVLAKIRLGFDEEHKNAVEVAEQLAAAGVAAITVHGRTRSQFYGGRANWEEIRRVKEAVPVPVIGSGDIFTPEDAGKMLAVAGTDAVMLARGILGNPWLIGRTVKYLATGAAPPEPEMKERWVMMLRHFELAVARKGEQQGVVQMRKHLAWYTKGLPGAARLREEIMHATEAERVRQILKSYFKVR